MLTTKTNESSSLETKFDTRILTFFPNFTVSGWTIFSFDFYKLHLVQMKGDSVTVGMSMIKFSRLKWRNLLLLLVSINHMVGHCINLI